MNLLSMLSFGCFVCFLFLIIYTINEHKKNILKVYAVLVCSSLGIWAFSYSFFYAAPTEESAWFWHKAGSIGWSTFPVFVLWFFLVQTGRDKKIKKNWHKAALYLMPAVVLTASLLGTTTPGAVELVQSGSGLGWAYVNEISNIWFWVYVIYLGAYLGSGLYFLWDWGRKSKYFNQKRQSFAILYSDAIVLFIGGITDLILPLINSHIPPMANIALVVFIYGFWISINKYDIFNVYSAAGSDIILDTIMDHVIIMDRDGKIVRCNKTICSLLDYTQAELVGKNVLELLDENSRRYVDAQIKRLLRDKSTSGREFILVKKDGTKVHTVVSASVAEDKIKGFLGIVASYHDITARKQMEKELKESNRKYRLLADELYHAAHFDSLTNLPNRRYFFHKAMSFIDDYNEYGTDFAAIYIDLNDFKVINDTYGHGKGDEILVKAAEKLMRFVGDKDLLARIGGDEFIMLLGDVSDKDGAESRAYEIRRSFEAGIYIGKRRYDLGASVGYSLYSKSEDIDELIKRADNRMYAEKMKACKNYVLREETRKYV